MRDRAQMTTGEARRDEEHRRACIEHDAIEASRVVTRTRLRELQLRVRSAEHTATRAADVGEIDRIYSAMAAWL